MTGERFDGFTTTAEEQWLTGSGPQPPRPQERLPERAPLMVPRPAAGSWPVEVLRAVRVWVADGALRVRDRDGAERVVAPAGAVTGVWWVAGNAPAALDLPAARTDVVLAATRRERLDAVPGSAGGWLVFAGVTEPVLALRLRDWLPWLSDADSADAVRATGAEAMAKALGVRFEAEADPASALRVVGRVPSAARLELDVTPVTRMKSGRVLLTPLVILALYVLLLWLLAPAVATAVAAVLLVGCAFLSEWLPWRGRVQRVRRLPSSATTWWSDSRRPGAGIGLVRGVLGAELVLADGSGWEAWFPGPALGGAGSLVVCTHPDGGPWGLALHARDQQLLELRAAADWEPLDGLAAAVEPMGLQLSTAVRESPEPLSGRRATRAAMSPVDSEAGFGGALVSALMTPLFWVVAALWLDLTEGWVMLGVGAGLLLGRLLLRRRTVL